MSDPVDPAQTGTPGERSTLDGAGYVKMPGPGLDDALTPAGAHRIFVVLAQIVELLRGIIPETRESVAAKAAKDRSRAAAWEAASVALRSKWAIPALTIATGAGALIGLSLFGVDLEQVPAIVHAVRQCPVGPAAQPGG